MRRLVSRNLNKLASILDPQGGINSKAPKGFFIPLQVPEALERSLDAIPSETTPTERRFLFHFFSKIWKAEFNVIEIGPFLGGTTRAIALGMLHNPRFNIINSKLITYDRFQSYYDSSKLSGIIDPIIKNGTIKSEVVKTWGDKVTFRQIFDTVHMEQDYFTVIEPVSMGVPDLVDELESGTDFIVLNENQHFDAVFVDGCKSWYGTKYFMKEVSKSTNPGAYYIFQDYGWYTCFWIAAFLEIFSDYFELVGNVDATYTFQLKKQITPALIDEKFPDTPEEISGEDFSAIFNASISAATKRKDSFGAFRNQLHKAGALAYIGLKDEAKQILTSLKSKDRGQNAKIIALALQSPTYSPHGPILFL
jgi:hypothetical protein